MEFGFEAINKLAVDSLVKNLNTIDGLKNLVVDGELIKVIDRLIRFSEFKKKGDINKVYLCETKLIKSPEDSHVQWVYIVRPDIKHIKMIVNHINNDLETTKKKSVCKILFSPKKFHLCEALLEQEGVYEYTSLGEIDLDLFLLDTNILSLEFRDFFKTYFLYGDQSWFPCVARSLIKIQKLFGTIPNVHLHGSAAKGIFELMRILKRTNDDESTNDSNFKCKVGHLILIDRSVDYITPFCSPLTYEGLLDEIYKIKAGVVEIPDLPIQEKAEKKMVLSNESKIFPEIRDLHFADALTYLKKKISELQESEDKRHDLSKDLTKLREFVENDLKKILEEKKMVNKHLEACKLLLDKKLKLDLQSYLAVEYNILIAKEYKKSVEYIEEIMGRKFDMYQVLRLMILLSVTNEGIPQSDYTLLTNVFLQTYGYERILLLNKLQKFGLFYASEATMIKEDSKSNLFKSEISSKIMQHIGRIKPTNYKYIQKKLNIIPNDPEKVKSNDMSYLYNKNYRPIMCKYIEQMLLNAKQTTKANKDFDEITKLLQGDYEFHTEDLSRRPSTNNMEAHRTVLIYFLGGVSYSEISSLKLLERQYNYEFYYATTGFISITSFINTLEDLDE